mmetsp:Transcript_84341/g.243835  ORF Transcript_84341/g.243835 Transcript_84341/m.243835 type:complete len:316 (+) Transcript_84341:694-1641(+)
MPAAANVVLQRHSPSGNAWRRDDAFSMRHSMRRTIRERITSTLPSTSSNIRWLRYRYMVMPSAASGAFPFPSAAPPDAVRQDSTGTSRTTSKTSTPTCRTSSWLLIWSFKTANLLAMQGWSLSKVCSTCTDSFPTNNRQTMRNLWWHHNNRSQSPLPQLLQCSSAASDSKTTSEARNSKRRPLAPPVSNNGDVNAEGSGGGEVPPLRLLGLEPIMGVSRRISVATRAEAPRICHSTRRVGMFSTSLTSSRMCTACSSSQASLSEVSCLISEISRFAFSAVVFICRSPLSRNSSKSAVNWRNFPLNSDAKLDNFSS